MNQDLRELFEEIVKLVLVWLSIGFVAFVVCLTGILIAEILLL